MVRLHLVHSQCRCLNSVLTREALVLYPQSPSWVVEQLYWLPRLLSYPFDPGAVSTLRFQVNPQIAGRYIVSPLTDLVVKMFIYSTL